MSYFRDSISDPYPSEFKDSPGFESVSTAYKTALSQDEEARQHQPHSSGESLFSALFKRGQRLIGLYDDYYTNGMCDICDICEFSSL
jgi:hypothetical protein